MKSFTIFLRYLLHKFLLMKPIIKVKENKNIIIKTRINVVQREIALYVYKNPHCTSKQLIDLKKYSINTIKRYLKGNYKRDIPQRYIQGILLTMNHVTAHGKYKHGNNEYDDDFTFNEEYAFLYREIKDLEKQKLNNEAEDINNDYIVQLKKNSENFLTDLIDTSLEFNIQTEGESIYLDNNDYKNFREDLINLITKFFQKKSLYHTLMEKKPDLTVSFNLKLDFLNHFNIEKKNLLYEMVFLPYVYRLLKDDLKENPSFYYEIGKLESQGRDLKEKNRINKMVKFYNQLDVTKIEHLLEDEKYYHAVFNWLDKIEALKKNRSNNLE